MSIHIERNGKNIRLNTFVTDDVISYLEISFAILKETMEIAMITQTADVVVAKVQDSYFTIHARDTHIEIAFNEKDYEIGKKVIDMMKKWKQFSADLGTFYVTFENKNTITAIFENGYIPVEEYTQRYKRFNPIIVHFRNK